MESFKPAKRIEDKEKAEVMARSEDPGRTAAISNRETATSEYVDRIPDEVLKDNEIWGRAHDKIAEIEGEHAGKRFDEKKKEETAVLQEFEKKFRSMGKR